MSHISGIARCKACPARFHFSTKKMKFSAKYFVLIIIFMSVFLFLRDVHTVTQDKIATLKRNLVLAVEQRDAIRLDIETLQAANSELLSSRKALQEADSKRKEEIDSLTRLKESQSAIIADLQRDLDKAKAALTQNEKVGMELAKEKLVLQKQLEEQQRQLDRHKLLSKQNKEMEQEIASSRARKKPALGNQVANPVNPDATTAETSRSELKSHLHSA